MIAVRHWVIAVDHVRPKQVNFFIPLKDAELNQTPLKIRELQKTMTHFLDQPLYSTGVACVRSDGKQ